MGEYRETCQMNWLLLILSGVSFLRVILKDFGLVLDDGFILISDCESSARQFVETYIERSCGNGVPISTWGRQKIVIPNYCCGLLIARNGIGKRELAEFLAQREFLPVVVCGGILPEELECDRYLFRLKREDLQALDSQAFSTKIEKFYSYLKDNTSTVCKIISRIENSVEIKDYSGDYTQKPLFKILVTIGKVYTEYLSEFLPEREALNFFHRFMQETKVRINKFPHFASGENLKEILSTLIGEYISQKQILPINKENLSGDAWKAFKENKAVIFDENFYYFSPKLFHEICAPLLETASKPQLKKQLRDKGFLYCNSADYTTKLNLVNVYGQKERPRMLWIHRDRLKPLEKYIEAPKQKKSLEVTSIV